MEIIDSHKKEIICLKKSPDAFFNFLFLLIILSSNFYLVYLSTTDSSFLWLAIGVFIFFTIPFFYRLFFGYNKIEANNNTIIFINTLTNKNSIFSYDDITLFKSYLLRNPIGPIGGASAGESYNVFDLEIGDNFTTNVSEKEFHNFQELKLFIHLKVNGNSDE